MKYGLIGERLGHSFSREIHARLADYDYELCEVAREDIDAFFDRGDFLGINVTIPYKETVIPHLYSIDEAARRIGAVNTVVNRDGRLYGYNTDFYGLTKLAEHAGVGIKGKRVAILGTGGTSKTARAVSATLGAKEILTVSRRAGEGVITYDELYREHADVDVIINTTPVGMYPNAGCAAVDISKFERLSGVLDAVYNPLSPRLIVEAKERGIPAEGGLYMLVAQAVRASEIFTGKEYGDGIIDAVYKDIYLNCECIVLVGMPASGKSSVGKRLCELLGRELVDTDALIVEEAGIPIPEIFSRYGEEEFRNMESRALRRAASLKGAVIATGGGAVLREENVAALRECGRIYFIDRPLEALVPTDDRPLSRDRASIEALYEKRYPIYKCAADVHVDGSGTVSEVADRIIKELGK